MKKIALLLLTFCVLAVSSGYAQKGASGMVIKFKTTLLGTDDPNILSQMPEGSTTYMLGNYTKSTQEGPGYAISTIMDANKKVQSIVYDLTGMGKYILQVTEADVTEAEKKIQREYTYLDERKNIAGYDCQKVIVKLTNLEDDSEEEIVLYISKDLNSNPDINFGSFTGLVGYPLRTEMKRDLQGTEVTVISEAAEVTPSKKIKAVDFMLPSDGKVLTMDEFRELFGGGGEDDE